MWCADLTPIPEGALQYWIRTLTSPVEAITEQVNKVNLTTTICADDRNIIQQDGSVVTYDPNVAAFNAGVGMVAPGAAGNKFEESINYTLAYLVQNINVVVDKNIWMSPRGQIDGSRITVSANGNSFAGVNQGIAIVQDFNYTAVVQRGNTDWCFFGVNNSGDVGAFFNLNTGAVGTILGPAEASVIKMGAGVFRICIAGTLSASVVVTTIPAAKPADNVIGAVIGDYVDSWQIDYLEGTKIPGPIIYTAGAAETRAATVPTDVFTGTPTTNVRIGMGEADKKIVLDTLTDGAFFWESGDSSLSIVGGDLQADINGTVATIAAVNPADVEDGAYFVYEAGLLYAEANGVRGVGVVSAAPVFGATVNEGCDLLGANHFEGTPTLPTMLVQDITP